MLDNIASSLYPRRHFIENFLKTLFIVSDASVVDEGSFGTSSPEWIYTDTLPIPGTTDDFEVLCRVNLANLLNYARLRR